MLGEEAEDDLMSGPDMRRAGSAPSSTQQTHQPGHAYPICPFCGTPNESSIIPCRQCGMENTQATRAATRAKLGPWYVWQTRNPAAPGMNFATLLSLVERGKVTARSIVRGPTTYQLWRYAARVKGLSRELGLCWGCGGALPKTSRVCAACKRLQQPPIHPDVLIEHSDVPITPAVHLTAPLHLQTPSHQVPSTPTSPHEQHPQHSVAARQIPHDLTASEGPIEAPMMSAPLTDTPTEHATVLPTTQPAPQPSPATRQTIALARSFPANVPLTAPPSVNTHGLPIVDMGDQPLDSGMEFAAFDLPSRDPQKPRRGMRVFSGIALALLLACSSLGVALYLHPELSPRYAAWIHGAVTKISLMMHGKPPGGESATKPVDSANSIAGSPMTNINGDPRTLNSGFARPAASGTSRTPLQMQIGPGTSTLPRPSPVVPRIASPPHNAAEQTVTISPPPTPAAIAERQAYSWRTAAVQAEQQGDYATAVKQYQAIQSLHLPEGTGPSDIQARLDRARILLDAERR